MPKIIFQPLMICNPPSKTDLTSLCSGGMLSPSPQAIISISMG